MSRKLHVIIGSTRPGRVGPAIARWFSDFAAKDGQFEPVLVDLADFKLPVYDEPRHPRLQQYEHAHTKAWSASVAAADTFAFVAPEYDYSPSPALTNALIYLSSEWKYKPAGIVSYGGVSGGLRAAQALKIPLTALGMMPLPEGVPIPNYPQYLDADKGGFKSHELIDASAKTMLDELARWTDALNTMRAPKKVTEAA